MAFERLRNLGEDKFRTIVIDRCIASALGISGSSSGIMHTMIASRLRRGTAFGLLLLAVVSIATPAIRHSILRAAGWTLVVNERIGAADTIVVSGEADGAGVLEAADLVHSGVATRVAVFSYGRDAVVREFTRRGIPYEDKSARFVGELKALGLVDVEQIPTYVTGTEDEGPVLARWCDEHRFHSVVVVGSRDHSRRLRRVFQRSMKGHQTTVVVCSSPYSEFDPDRWWNSRSGTRTEIIELEKLFLDIVRHPIS
jgi:hypothetical protein